MIPSVKLIIGSPNSGKTTLIKFIALQQFDNFDSAYVFSNTYYGQWDDIIPEKNIFADYDANRLNILINNARKFKENNKNPPHILIIIDDCMGKKCDELKQIVLHRRHLNMSVIIANQFVKEQKPWLRSNLDYFYIFKQRTKSGLDSCHEIVQGFMDKDNFIKIIRDLKQHGFLSFNYQSGTSCLMIVQLPLNIRQFKSLGRVKLS